MTVPDWLVHLQRAVRAHPQSNRNIPKEERSRVVVTRKSVYLAFSFRTSLQHQTDLLLVNFIAGRVGVNRRKPPDGHSATVSFRCNEEQAKQFGRFLTYASTLPMQAAPPRVSHERTPLPELLTKVLYQFKFDYESNPPKGGIPSLEVWSNVLRPLGAKDTSFATLQERSVCTLRTLRPVFRHCTKLGWLTTQGTATLRPRTAVRLTPEGLRMRQAGIRRIKRVDQLWRESYGKRYEILRNSLAATVAKFPLAFPYSITGYGPADEALTGGNYLPPEPGPPRIPGRGMEWPVVLRKTTKSREVLPLSALLSQTLTAFGLDYEAEDLGRLGLTTMFFQFLPDEGITLTKAREYQAINGVGTSLHERHMNIVIEPGKPSDGSRMVYPTQKSRRARDAFPHLVSTIESRWAETYGKRNLRNLRSALTAIVDRSKIDSPSYPDTTIWMSPWYAPFQLDP